MEVQHYFWEANNVLKLIYYQDDNTPINGNSSPQILNLNTTYNYVLVRDGPGLKDI